MVTVSAKAAKYVEDGYVLSRKGQWVPLERAIAEEEELDVHLGQGEVVVDGVWVRLEEVAGGVSPPHLALPSEADEMVVDEKRGSAKDYTVDQETKVIALQELAASLDSEAPSAPADPSPPLSETGSEEDDLVSLDNLEEEAVVRPQKPDTVRLEVDLEGQEEETGPKDEGPALLSDDPLDTWEQTRGKRRMYLLVCAAAAALVVAAVLLLLRFAL